jgi:hypothetical protein
MVTTLNVVTVRLRSNATLIFANALTLKRKEV